MLVLGDVWRDELGDAQQALARSDADRGQRSQHRERMEHNQTNPAALAAGDLVVDMFECYRRSSEHQILLAKPRNGAA